MKTQLHFQLCVSNKSYREQSLDGFEESLLAHMRGAFWFIFKHFLQSFKCQKTLHLDVLNDEGCSLWTIGLASYYKLAVLCQLYIFEHYASSSKGRSLSLGPGGPASTT